MVSAGDVCRLCLAMDARLHVIAGTPLQKIYEKLTEISLNAPRRPVVACHMCYSRLRRCHELMVRSVRADKVLTEILQSGEKAKQEFIATIKQYHVDDGLCVTPTKLIDITNNKDGLIKDEIKEELQPTQSWGLITTELIEFEESGGEKDTERCVPVYMEDIDSEEFINEEDIKVEVLEHPLNVDGQELAGANVKLEVFEEVQDIATEGLVDTDNIKQEQLEVVQHNEIEGAVPSNNYEKIQDITTPTTQGLNTLRIRKRKAVLEEEISSTSTATYMLRSANNAANKRPAFKNIPMYVDTTVNKDNLSVNSDYDCTSTETDVDNSGREHLKKVVISDECGDVSDDKYLLVERTEHRNVGKKTVNRKSGEGSSHQRSLLGKHKHTDTPRGRNLFEREICQRKFKTKCNLTIHLSRDTSYRPFDISKAKCDQKLALKTPCRIHTGEKPFECEICKAKFGLKSYLKIHYRTHTGEKPFECHICKAKFNDKSNLKSHLRTHTGEKPFECDICIAKFSRKSTLKIHVRTHTGEKPFECEICKVKFSHKYTLNRHLRTHLNRT